MADLAGAIEFVVYMHATLAELLAFARCPIELTVDGAEGTNNQMLTSMNVMGRDANDKANRAAHVFVPSETNLAASTVIESLLPLLYGAVLDGVRLWVADGGLAFNTVIPAAIERGLYGRAVFMLCWVGASARGAASMRCVGGAHARCRAGPWAAVLTWRCVCACAVGYSGTWC